MTEPKKHSRAGVALMQHVAPKSSTAGKRVVLRMVAMQKQVRCG